MAERTFDPEKLRPPIFVCEPDPRSTGYVRLDPSSGTTRPMELDDHHQQIAGYVLHAGVPEEIVVQFETAKNLCLYAWFVYRFYPVAEHQAFACLELAFRERLKEEIRTKKVKFRGKRPTLQPLLVYVVEQGLVKNEGFVIWRNRGEINSRKRVEMEKIREMRDKNLTQITWDDSEIKVLPEDLEWDYVKMLLHTLPRFRNAYVHGSTNLLPSVLMIQLVCEIINQLFAAPAGATT